MLDHRGPHPLLKYEPEAEVIAKRLSLPNLTTSAGLKKFVRASTTHAVSLWNEWYSHPSHRGAILCLMHFLVMDENVRSYFAEFGFVDMLLEAMIDPELLSTDIGFIPATFLAGLLGEDAEPETRKYIVEKAAKHAYDYAKAKQAGPNVHTDYTYHASISLLSYSVLERKEPDGTTTYYVPYLDAEEVIDVLVNSFVLHELITVSHALHGIVTLAKSLPHDRFWTMASFHQMLVGYLRHPSINIRFCIFGFLWNYVLKDAELEPTKFPPDVTLKIGNFLKENADAKALYASWLESGGSVQDTYHIAHASNMRAYEEAMDALCDDNDFYELGETLYNVLQLTDFADDELMVPVMIPGTDNLYISKVSEALSICAKEIRKRDGDDSLRAACLDVKHCMMTRKYAQAHQLARKHLARHPYCAYLYYALSVQGFDFQTVLDCRKGLMVMSTPEKRYSYMRIGLLHNAVALQMTLAWFIAGGDKLSKQLSPRGCIEAGFILGQCALADSLELLRTYSPDNPVFLKTLHRHMCFAVVLYGQYYSLDLRDLNELAYAARTVSRLTRATYFDGVDVRPPSVVMWEDVIEKHFASAAKKYVGAMTAQVNSDVNMAVRMQQPVGKPEGGKALYRCVVQLAEEVVNGKFDGQIDKWTLGMADTPVYATTKPYNFLTLYGDIISMHLCTECKKPSANLKQCARCGKARYCDRECQSRNWRLHKADCKT